DDAEAIARRLGDEQPAIVGAEIERRIERPALPPAARTRAVIPGLMAGIAARRPRGPVGGDRRGTDGAGIRSAFRRGTPRRVRHRAGQRPREPRVRALVHKSALLWRLRTSPRLLSWDQD